VRRPPGNAITGGQFRDSHGATPTRRSGAPLTGTRYDCGVRAEEVVELLDALLAERLRMWLDGGWGVDALLSEQTREHDDVDLVVELRCLEDVIAALTPLGFERHCCITAALDLTGRRETPDR
jgi:Aminoglycoside-2''-adenylyltransferase